MWFLYLLGIVIALVIDYFIAKKFSDIAEMKGHEGNTYFWFTFWLGLVGMLMVIALPEKEVYDKKSLPSFSLPLQPVEAPRCEPSVKQTPITEPQNNDNKKHVTAEIVDGNKVCPNCKLSQRANRTICWQCGAIFDN